MPAKVIQDAVCGIFAVAFAIYFQREGFELGEHDVVVNYPGTIPSYFLFRVLACEVGLESFIQFLKSLVLR